VSARLAPSPGLDRRGLGLGRPAVLVSLALHVLACVIVLGVPRLLARAPGVAPIYVVDLVSLPGGGPAGPQAGPASQAPPPPKPPSADARTATPPKKAPEKAIVLPERGARKSASKTPPKPAAPSKPEEPQQDAGATKEAALQGAASANSPASPAPGPATPEKPDARGAGGQGDGSGGGGQGSGLGGDEYNFYLALLDRSIKGAWKRPLYKGREVLSAVVRLQISRSGRVVRLDLVQTSGLDALDRSVLRAVRDAEPFPPLPSALTLDSLPVQVLFELNPQGAADETPRD